jgi:translation initiation factor RLI1
MAFAATLAVIGAVGAAATAGVGIAEYIRGNKDRRKARASQKVAKAELEQAKDQYLKMDTSNPYLNMENTMEDLTVDTKAAEFAAANNEAAMATTLNNMNQAAGGSGIAALAQALANQGAIANQKASLSIAEQERANQAAERKEASSIQNLERQGEIQSRNLKGRMAGEMLRLAAGELSNASAAERAATGDMKAGVDTVFKAGGTFLSTLDPQGGV